MKQAFLILMIALLATVISEEQSTVAPTKSEIPEPPGFFTAAFNYVEMGLKRLFGFKGEDSHDNSTSIATDSHLLKVLSNPTDRTQQLLGSGSVGNVSTVTAAAAVIVVKEDHTTQKQP